MSRPTIGLLVGLALGLAIAIDGFSGFLVTAVAAGVGYLLGKVLDGELDLSSYLGGGGRRRP
jgi:hypothetical protein